jgi:hypothetical protein
MEPADHTLRVLTEIRDEVRGTNERVDQTNERVHQTNERLVHLEEALSRRIVESEMRTATAITELAHSVQGLTGFLRDALGLEPRVAQCERDIQELKERVS